MEIKKVLVKDLDINFENTILNSSEKWHHQKQHKTPLSDFKVKYFAGLGNLTNETLDCSARTLLSRAVLKQKSRAMFIQPCRDYIFGCALCICTVNEGLLPSGIAKKIIIMPLI